MSYWDRVQHITTIVGWIAAILATGFGMFLLLAFSKLSFDEGKRRDGLIALLVWIALAIFILAWGWMVAEEWQPAGLA